MKRSVEQSPEEALAHNPTTQPDGAIGLVETGEAHQVSAVYPGREDAETVRLKLVEQGVPSADIVLLHASDPPLPEQPFVDAKSDDALKDMLVDGIIGTALGTGVGAIGTVVIAAANVTLFVASPVIAPLAMLGWFAGVGGLVGAAAGADSHTGGRFSDLIKAVIKAGNTVLMVRTHDAAGRHRVEEIINDSLVREGDDAGDVGAA